MPITIPQLLLLWLCVVNLAGFSLMGLDKRRAQRGQWRISERTLFLPPLLGGALGGILGMRLFRHKTQHWYFAWGFPAILICQLTVAIWLYCRFYP